MYQIEGIQKALKEAEYWRAKRLQAEKAEHRALDEVHEKRREALRKTTTIEITETVIANRVMVSGFTALFTVQLPAPDLPEYPKGYFDRVMYVSLEINPRGIFMYSAWIAWKLAYASDPTPEKPALFNLDLRLMEAFPHFGVIWNSQPTQFSDENLLRVLYDHAVQYIKSRETQHNRSLG